MAAAAWEKKKKPAEQRHMLGLGMTLFLQYSTLGRVLRYFTRHWHELQRTIGKYASSFVAYFTINSFGNPEMEDMRRSAVSRQMKARRD
jgi:hypothetical protein